MPVVSGSSGVILALVAFAVYTLGMAVAWKLSPYRLHRSDG